MGTTRKQPFRLIGGVVAGYLTYAVGLMALVVTWFVRGTGVHGIVAHLVNGVALLILGWLVGMATNAVAGDDRRPALVIVGLVVIGVGVANMSMGMAIEPAWYTTLAVVMTVSALFVRLRQSASTTR